MAYFEVDANVECQYDGVEGSGYHFDARAVESSFNLTMM